MLVLSRHANEGITIILEDGREIHVHVVKIDGDKVRLGTEADKDIAVHRDEVWLEIKKEELLKSNKQTSTIPRQCFAPEHKEV